MRGKEERALEFLLAHGVRRGITSTAGLLRDRVGGVAHKGGEKRESESEIEPNKI